MVLKQKPSHSPISSTYRSTNTMGTVKKTKIKHQGPDFTLLFGFNVSSHALTCNGCESQNRSPHLNNHLWINTKKSRVPLYHSQAKILRCTSWQCIASPCHLVCVIKCWHLNSLQNLLSLHCHWNHPRNVVSYLNWAPFWGWSKIVIPKESKYCHIFFWHSILSFQDVPSSIYSCLFLCKKGFPKRAKEVSGPGNVFFPKDVSKGVS